MKGRDFMTFIFVQPTMSRLPTKVFNTILVVVEKLLEIQIAQRVIGSKIN